MLPSLRHPGRVTLLVAAATGLNLVGITLPGDAQLLLGPFLYMPLVLTLRMPWAVLAAAVPMAATIPMFGNPFLFLVGTAEAMWLGLALRRWRGAPLLHDVVFWIAAGLPACVAIYHGVLGLPDELVAIIAGKQLFNQTAAVVIASFLLRHTAACSWLGEGVTGRRRMRDTVFQIVFVLAMVPLALVGIGVSVLLWVYTEREDRQVLVETGQRLTQQLDLFLGAHEAVVTTLAGTLSRGGGDAATLLEEVQRSHPAFITMLVADAQGHVTHAAPEAMLERARGTSIADRDYFRQARERGRPFVSGVFRGRGFGNDVLVAISAPVHDEAGRFAGVVEGSLEVHAFARLIVGNRQDPTVALIFTDAGGRVIYADAELGIPPLADLRGFPQGALLAPAQAEGRLRFDAREHGGELTRFTAYATRQSADGVVVIAQRPLLAGLEGSGWVFLLFGGVTVCIIALAAWAARWTRRRTAAPLELFASHADRQAGLGRVEPLPELFTDAPYEVVRAFGAFNQLAVQLQGSYEMLRQNNEALDRRVAERTAEAEAARAQAEAANQSKSDFLAMTSHEIRTPLNAIIGLAESLGHTVREPVARERLGTIRQAGERLMRVVNDLLDLTRVEAGRLELQPAPVEVGALCDEVRTLFAMGARERGLELLVEFDAPRPLWVEADGARLQQVLINLVGNALKFTPAGRVVLRVTRERELAEGVALRFAVIDSGPGIPRAEQARLFQPFVQLPGSERSAVPGTGLGLFISRRLVDLFGAALSVRSEPGAGTEFHFTIVLHRAEPPPVTPVPEAAAKPPPAAASVAGLRVLAVDDNLANQEVLRSMLETVCTRLVVVDDAAAALAELARTRFDVALVDLEMPVADGFSVARQVRAWGAGEASQDCRLIALSAHRRQEMWEKAVAAGFDDFVEKPIDRRALLGVIGAAAGAVAAAPAM